MVIRPLSGGSTDIMIVTEYIDVSDAMAGYMEPKTPCAIMPTRPCVVWNEPPQHAEDRYFPIEQCAVTCWRYKRPVAD